MIVRKIFDCLLFSFVFVSGLFAQRNPEWAVSMDAKYVANLYAVDSGVYRCARPDASACAELKQLGIGEVLNLCYLAGNDKSVLSAGLTQHRVKLLAGKISEEKVVDALRIIKNRQSPIVVHCKHGADRTGLIIALYRIVFQDWSKDAAIEELETGDYNFHPVYSNIPAFIKNVDEISLKKAVFDQ